MLKDKKAAVGRPVDAKPDAGKEYLDEKIKSAKWIIKSMEQRQRTILRVTEKILERQREFSSTGFSI